jgi:hypothetical protein
MSVKGSLKPRFVFRGSLRIDSMTATRWDRSRGRGLDRSSRTPDSFQLRAAYRRAMARTGTEIRETFLVEHYRPGLTPDELRALAVQIRDTTNTMEREGKAVRYLRATIVPTDESLLCLLEAASDDLVREAYARAELPFERITAVIPDGIWVEGSRSSKEVR